jgi:hypothetical protein
MISQMPCKYCETHTLHPNANLKNSLKPDWNKSLELLTKARAAEEINTETETEPEVEVSENGDNPERNLTQLSESPTHSDE